MTKETEEEVECTSNEPEERQSKYTPHDRRQVAIRSILKPYRTADVLGIGYATESDMRTKINHQLPRVKTREVTYGERELFLHYGRTDHGDKDTVGADPEHHESGSEPTVVIVLLGCRTPRLVHFRSLVRQLRNRLIICFVTMSKQGQGEFISN